jgi:hypothetical protein
LEHSSNKALLLNRGSCLLLGGDDYKMSTVVEVLYSIPVMKECFPDKLKIKGQKLEKVPYEQAQSKNRIMNIHP